MMRVIRIAVFCVDMRGFIVQMAGVAVQVGSRWLATRLGRVPGAGCSWPGGGAMLPGKAVAPKDERSGASAKTAEGAEIAADDPAYFNAIPGVKQVFTEDALLDLWVRDQQIAWLKDSDEAYNVDELRERVRKRVQAIKTKELHNTVRGLRSELISYSIFVVLFSMVLTAFTLSSAYPFSTKVKAHVLKQYQGAQFSEDITTTDDAWDWVVNQLTPAIFSPWSAPYQNSDLRNVMIGAVQLQQVLSRPTTCVCCAAVRRAHPRCTSRPAPPPDAGCTPGLPSGPSPELRGVAAHLWTVAVGPAARRPNSTSLRKAVLGAAHARRLLAPTRCPPAIAACHRVHRSAWRRRKVVPCR